MYTAALFTIAKIWKQPKCPSADEWINKRWYIYTMEFYAAVERKELLCFGTAWMDLETLMLSEISQSVKDQYHMISLICGILYVESCKWETNTDTPTTWMNLESVLLRGRSRFKRLNTK